MTIPSEMDDVSAENHRYFRTKFSVSVDGATSFAVAFSETYSTAPRDVPRAIADQLRSMGLKNSKEQLAKIVSPGIASYCARPERNDDATVWVCLIVPKDDTVKVVSFDAPNDLGWRRSARAIMESIKIGRHIQWGGLAKIGANTLKLQLDNSWTLNPGGLDQPTYRLLRRAEFGQVGPSCELTLGQCKDDSSFRDELHGKLEGRMACDGSRCDAQIDKIAVWNCFAASCDAVATQAEQLELQVMLRSVDRSLEPRGR